MEQKYVWEDSDSGSVLYAEVFYEKEKIAYIEQNKEDTNRWEYAFYYFSVECASLEAESLQEAKKTIIEKLQENFSDKINFYKEMKELFK